MSSVQSGLRWSRKPDRCSPIRRATSSGRNNPWRSSLPGSSSRSRSGASSPRSQRATGMPNPFLGRARIDRGSLPETAPLSNRLVWLRRYLNWSREAAARPPPGPCPGRERGLPDRRPCWRGRPWSRCLREGRSPGTSASDRVRGSASGASAAATARCSASTSRGGPLPWLQEQSRELGAGERAEPPLVRQGKGLGGAAEELLDLEIEGEVAIAHRQPPGRGLRQGPGRSRAGGDRVRPPARPRTSDSRPAARRRRLHPARP